MAAGAAFWVRIGSQLTRDKDFDAWQKDFDKAKPCSVVVADNQRVDFVAPGKDGPLSITAKAPWDQAGRVQLEPKPFQGLLEVNGKELGLPLLAAVEPLCSLPPGTGPLVPTTVPAGKVAFWEAESGLILPGMAIGEDPQASGGRYVGQESSPIGQPSGSVTWTLAIERPGRYWLWARVRSADARHGAFLVSGDWGRRGRGAGGNLDSAVPRHVAVAAAEVRGSGVSGRAGIVSRRVPHTISNEAVGYDDRSADADRGPETAAVNFVYFAPVVGGVLFSLHS